MRWRGGTGAILVYESLMWSGDVGTEIGELLEGLKQPANPIFMAGCGSPGG